MAPILRKVRAISVSRTAQVFVDGGASIGISVMFGLSSLPDGHRFKRPVYRPFKDRYGRQNGLRASRATGGATRRYPAAQIHPIARFRRGAAFGDCARPKDGEAPPAPIATCATENGQSGAC